MSYPWHRAQLIPRKRLLVGLAASVVAISTFAVAAAGQHLTGEVTSRLFSGLKAREPAVRILGVQAEQTRLTIRFCIDAEGWCGSVVVVGGQDGCTGSPVGDWCVMAQDPDMPETAWQILHQVLGETEADPIPGTTTTRSRTLRDALFDRFAPRSLLHPLASGTVLDSGWTVARIEARSPLLFVVLVGPAGERVVAGIEDRRLEAGEVGSCRVLSRGYCLGIVGGRAQNGPAGSSADPAIEDIGLVLVANDAFNLWDIVLPASFWHLFLLAVFLGVAGSTIVTACRRFRDDRPPPWVAWALIGVTGLAVFLRWQVSPWTFLHEFFHVNHRLSALYGMSFGVYGETGPALFRAVHELFGEGTRSIFLTNWFLSVATVPALAWLAHGLLGRWDGAILSALILALLPQHLRFSASEVLPIAGTFFLVVSLAMTVRFAKVLDGWSLFGAVGGLFLATQSRPEMIHAPLVALALLPVARPGGMKALLLRADVIVSAVLLVIAIGAGRLLGGMLPDALPHVLAWRSLQWPWFSVEWTPAWLIAASVLGIAVQVGRDRRLAGWLAFGFLVSSLLPLTFYSNPIFNLRTQLPSLPFAVLASASGLVWLLDRVPPRRHVRLTVGAVVIGLLVFGTWVRIGPVTTLRAVQQEWMFIQQAMPGLPDGAGSRLVASRGSGPEFPEDLIWHERKLLMIQDIKDFQSDGAGVDGPGDSLFYQGMYCYTDAGVVGGKRPTLLPLCARMREDFALDPLVEAELPGPLDPPLSGSEGRGPFPIGFYRIVGPRPPTGSSGGERQSATFPGAESMSPSCR